jgi:hypothetical protein
MVDPGFGLQNAGRALGLTTRPKPAQFPGVPFPHDSEHPLVSSFAAGKCICGEVGLAPPCLTAQRAGDLIARDSAGHPNTTSQVRMTTTLRHCVSRGDVGPGAERLGALGAPL